MVRFVKITRPARECPIRFIVIPREEERLDVFDLERKVEDSLWRLAILALVSSAWRNHRIVSVH
jgi:hypothetical protein